MVNGEQVEALTTALREANLKMDNLIPLVEAHERALRGSNGRTGLVALFDLQTQRLADWEVRLQAMDVMLNGDPEDESSLGLKGTVNEMNKSIKALRRFGWIVLGAAVGTGVNVVILLVIHGSVP
ncbi:MAG: hypothetical protein PVG14_15645 [Anaerolineales bacterium]|jgi:hypothetical protein